MERLSTPAKFIRERIFGISTQEEFADMLGCAQATISRYETGELRLSRDAQDAIRLAARERGLRWDNNWFFDIPTDLDASPCGDRAA